jgi:four helix bundle protein
MVSGELSILKSILQIMFLKLNHQNLEVFQYSKKVVLECYKLTIVLPSDEKFNMVSQIRRAALSVHLNIAEGSSRKSAVERKRYYEIARGSMIEIDAALDIAFELGYLNDYDSKHFADIFISAFKLLSGLINSSSN